MKPKQWEKTRKEVRSLVWVWRKVGQRKGWLVEMSENERRGEEGE